MADIIERCSSVDARIEAYTQREKLHDQATAIEARRQELEKIKTPLTVALRRALTLIGDGCLQAESIPDVASTRTLLGAVRERLASDPSKLASGREYKKLLGQLETLCTSIATAVDEAWAARRDRADPVDARVLERLKHIPGLGLAIQTVKTLRDRMHQLGNQPPETAGSLADFDAVARELMAAWNEIELLGDLPEAVLQFFREAKRPEGASMSVWTEEVRTWLEQHDMLESVRVHFGKGRTR